MPPISNKRAVLLISVLFVTLIILTFVQALFVAGPVSQTSARLKVRQGASQRAIRNGLEWARCRLAADPGWCAEGAPRVTRVDGLTVEEGNGQVVGWTRDGSLWSRFRMRFNYQDGPSSNQPNSDFMDDPPSPWNDLPYVSCNNARGGAIRSLPLAGSSGLWSHSGPWPQTQLSVPAGAVLLSIEGSAGTTDSIHPDRFFGGVQKSTAQVVLTLRGSQSIPDSAISSSGDLDIDLFGSTLQLETTGSESVKIRSKDGLRVGAVNSTDGELRFASTISTGTLSNVTTSTDRAQDGFYQITADQVRRPSDEISLSAGTYVLASDGTLRYHSMNYADYANADPKPSGAAVDLPDGLELEGPLNGAPRFRLKLSRDLSIQSQTAVTDFALIPDGGADQSEDYGGVGRTTPPLAPAVVDDFANWLAGRYQGQSTDFRNAWLNVANTFGHGAALSADQQYVNYWIEDNPTQTQSEPHIAIPVDPNNSMQILVNTQGNPAVLTQPLRNAPAGAVDRLMSFYSGYTPPAPAPTPTPPATGGGQTGPLKPADVELQLQASADGGLTLANSSGSLILGTQIQGNGAALVSQGNISLIGTSTELSSSPGEALGLNLYAQGSIIIDAFALDADGASFRNISLRGILYAWQGVKIFAGNAASQARFDLTGQLVAYGGDPQGAPQPGLAQTSIRANQSRIVFDPRYVAHLVNQGPFFFEIGGWHQF